ncbi:MAG: hypothetical protein AAFV80_15830 [Bacteroidota bacterium]
MKQYLAILLFGAFCLQSCIKPPEYDEVPEITFISFDKMEVAQNIDNVVLTFGFQDGDGDLGLTSEETGTNGILIDLRTGFENTFRIPFIPQQGVANGISGEISIDLPAECCIPMNSEPCQPNPDAPNEELRYSIQITDRAGNSSNVVETEPVILLCN